MCESPIRKRSVSTKCPGLCEPSKSRVEAQQFINLSHNHQKAGLPKKKQETTYPVVKVKNKGKVVKAENTSVNESGSKTEILADTDLEPPHAELKEKVITCSLKTTTYGLKKAKATKRIHSYRCPDCKEKFRKLSLLNDHYKGNHSPLMC